jgi:hypothetical protein
VSRTTLQRNAAIALGNSGSKQAVSPLTHALQHNERALVRLHAAWALGELFEHLDSEAWQALHLTSEHDPDRETRDEAEHVIGSLRARGRLG